MKVTLFVPCLVDLMFPNVGISMVKILERLGQTVECPEEVACCGLPAFDAGYRDEARSVAAKAIRRFRDAEVVVIGAGSCATMMRVFNPDLFAGDPLEEEAKAVAAKCYEFSDFLVTKLGVTDLGARFEAKVTFHDGCRSLRELRIKDQPRQLLSKVQGLQLIEMREAICCGFGGPFAVQYPMISTAIGEVKCSLALETGADYIVSNDSGCLMHIQGLLDRQRSRMKTLHLAEVLAQS